MLSNKFFLWLSWIQSISKSFVHSSCVYTIDCIEKIKSANFLKNGKNNFTLYVLYYKSLLKILYKMNKINKKLIIRLKYPPKGGGIMNI